MYYHIIYNKSLKNGLAYLYNIAIVGTNRCVSRSPLDSCRDRTANKKIGVTCIFGTIIRHVFIEVIL